MLHVRIIHRAGTIQRVKITDDAGRPIDFECTTHDLAQPPGRFCEHCGTGPECIVCGRNDLPPSTVSAAFAAARARLGIGQEHPTDLLTVDQ